MNYSRPSLFMTAYPTSGYWPDRTGLPGSRIGGTRADTLLWMTRLRDIRMSVAFSVRVNGGPGADRTASFNRTFSLRDAAGADISIYSPGWFYRDGAGTPWPDSGSRVLVGGVAGYDSMIIPSLNHGWGNEDFNLVVGQTTVAGDQRLFMNFDASSVDGTGAVLATLSFDMAASPFALTSVPFPLSPFGGDITLSYSTSIGGSPVVTYTGPTLSVVADFD